MDPIISVENSGLWERGGTYEVKISVGGWQEKKYIEMPGYESGTYYKSQWKQLLINIYHPSLNDVRSRVLWTQNQIEGYLSSDPLTKGNSMSYYPYLDDLYDEDDYIDSIAVAASPDYTSWNDDETREATEEIEHKQSLLEFGNDGYGPWVFTTGSYHVYHEGWWAESNDEGSGLDTLEDSLAGAADNLKELYGIPGDFVSVNYTIHDTREYTETIGIIDIIPDIEVSLSFKVRSDAPESDVPLYLFAPTLQTNWESVWQDIYPG